MDFGDRTPDVSELVDALKPEMHTRGFKPIVQTGRLSLQIGFDSGSNRPMERDFEKLNRLSQALTSDSLNGLDFEVVGHTDASGALGLNMRLSRQRANAVLDYLAQHGVERSRLSALGKGPADLLNPGNPNAAENRRVEVRIVQRPE